MAQVLASAQFHPPVQGDDKPFYQSKLYESDSLPALQVLINEDFEEGRQSENFTAIALFSVEFSSARRANNVINYSACVVYAIFGIVQP